MQFAEPDYGTLDRTMMSTLRITIIGIAFALLVGVAGFNAWQSMTAPKGTGSMSGGLPQLTSVGLDLVDQTGAKRDASVLKGGWTLVFFGYTYCPDFCPITLQGVGQTLKVMGPEASKMRVVFISIDPTRDTPENLKAYLESGGFPPGVIGLTGQPSQVDVAVKAFGAVAERGEAVDGGYLMNHTTYIYVLDPEGRAKGIMAYGMSPEQMADYLGRIMREG